MIAVLFDFNGVIADDEPQHARAFARVLEEEGIELTEKAYLSRYLGLDDRDLFRRVLSDHGRPTPHAAALDGFVATKAKAYLEEIDGGVALCDGASELVFACAEKYPLAVGSGARRHEIELILKRAELYACFATIVSADDVSAGKPSPETYATALARLREDHPALQAIDCIVIEDAPAGIRAAHAAGMRAIGVCGSARRQELHEAERVVDSLLELSPDELLPG